MLFCKYCGEYKGKNICCLKAFSDIIRDSLKKGLDNENKSEVDKSAIYFMLDKLERIIGEEE